MSHLICWMQALQGHLLEQICPHAEIPTVQSIRFVRHWESSDGGALWLGEGQELLHLLSEHRISAGRTFFAAGDAPGLVPLAQTCDINLVVTDLPMLDLFERLSTVLRRYQSWSTRLLEVGYQRHSIPDVVRVAAELAGGALFLLNAGCRVIHFGGHACLNAAPAREMMDSGQLSQASMGDLLGPDTDAQSTSPQLCRVMGSEGKCWAQRVFKDGSLISYMLLFTPTTWRDADVCALLGLVRTNVSRIAATERGTYWAGTDFKTLLAELVSGELSEEEEINRRFRLINRIPEDFCSFIIVESASPGPLSSAPTSLLTQLESLFPDANAALYDDGVVLLLSRPDRDFQPAPTFDRERLQALLTRYDAHAAISNATSRRAMLRTNYLLTKSVLQLGRALRIQNNLRIFSFEDYADYVTIDLCINSFSALLGHDDIIYLTHPDAVALYRYDLRHQTKLLDVLYYYCLNNGSVSQAAKAAFMHRNTFSARLAKLQQLIRADLSSGEIQQRMIFSYKILRYYDRYAKINLGKRLGVLSPREGMESPHVK